MRYQFFTIPIQQSAAETEKLNQFIASHKILSIEKELVTLGQQSFWSFCIAYDPGLSNIPDSKRQRIDYREVLSPNQFGVFSKLRDLRKKISDKEGIPAYAVFTNEQLAALVQMEHPNKRAMAALEGVGEGRLEKYGDAFLNLLILEKQNSEKLPRQSA